MSSAVCDQISPAGTPFQSKILEDYLNGSDNLSKFYQFSPDIKGIQSALSKRSKFPVDRQLLNNVIREQYTQMDKNFFDQPENQKVVSNLAGILSKNTYTVTTGHQPMLFGGPLYFISKIVSTINLASELQEKFKDYNFIPVLWLATEDHDFEEISEINLFGNKVKWQVNDNDLPVGRLNPESILPILDELEPKLQASRNGRFILELFRYAYSRQKSFAQATRYWVNRLFRSEGLIILDPDNEKLKTKLQDVAITDILNQSLFDKVKVAKDKLSQHYKTPVNPREINFFCLKDGKRRRIIPENGSFRLDKSEIVLSRIEMEKLIQETPGHLSPNVVTRPIYQELILPNIAYVGGPAESAYWFELKPAFDVCKTFFPVIIPRNSIVWIGKGITGKIASLGLSPLFLLKYRQQLEQDFISEISEDGEIESETEKLEMVYEHLKQSASAQPPELQKTVLDFAVPAKKNLQKFKKDLRKAIKQRNEIKFQQLLKMHYRLFPDGIPQERYDNFIPLYLEHGMNFLSVLLDNLSPWPGKIFVHCEQ